MNKHRAVCLALLSVVAAAVPVHAQNPDPCEAPLANGVFDSYQMADSREFRSRAERFFRSSRQEREQANDSFSMRLKALVPLDPIPIQGDGTTDYERSRSRQMDEKITEDESTTLDESELFWLVTKTASPAILQSWEQCMSERAQVSMNLQAQGDPQSAEFQIVLNWRPVGDYEPRRVLIKQVAITGAELAQDTTLITGNTLEPYTGITQVLRRKGCDPVVVTVHLAGFMPVRLVLPAVTPPAAPRPVYARQWTRRDDRGRSYVREFTHQHTGNAQLLSRSHGLGVANARIYRVVYECEGVRTHDGNNSCGWSTHPSGGYGTSARITDGGRSFRWSRRVEVAPVTVIHRVYYEVARDACVENCPGSQAPQAPSCPIGQRSTPLSFSAIVAPLASASPAKRW